ncbi:MAG: hypothetical protein ACREE7_09520, partial [Dongiaceae bacterium]
MQIGVNTLSWIDSMVGSNGPTPPDSPSGRPLASSPSPLPAQAVSSTAGTVIDHSVASVRRATGALPIENPGTNGVQDCNSLRVYDLRVVAGDPPMPAIRSFVAALLLAASAPADAIFHLMSIREVYVGPVVDANAQYVELQMYSAGQNFVDGHSLTFYGPTGTLLGTVTFTADVANGPSQAYIFVATNEAVTKFGVAADLVMTPLLDPVGGKVCFADVDCLSWGSYSGVSNTPSPSGNPFNP